MWNLMQSDLIILHHGCGTAEYHMRLFSIFQSILPFGYLILLFSFLLNSTINKNKNATFLPQRYLILSRMLVISSGGTLDILVFPTHSQKKTRHNFVCIEIRRKRNSKTSISLEASQAIGSSTQLYTIYTKRQQHFSHKHSIHRQTYNT